MTTRQITYHKCPFCRVGNMTFAPLKEDVYQSASALYDIGVISPTIALAGFPHRCSNCHKSMQLDKAYPIETTTATTQE